MQDITALQQRIAAALDRIDRRLNAPAPAVAVRAEPQPAAVVDPALTAKLEEERALTAQLQKQLRIAKEREAKPDTLARIDKLTQQLDIQGLELQRMRRVNTTLVQQVEALREAQMSEVTEPQLINRALAAELDALRSLRLTEMAELDEILTALEPHLTGADHA